MRVRVRVRVRARARVRVRVRARVCVQFDHVLIETSGLADPAPIMQTFFSHKMRGGTIYV